MTKLIREPVILPLGYQGEHYTLRITWPIERLYIQPEWDSPIPSPDGFAGLSLMMRPDDLPRHSPDNKAVYFDVGRAWKDYNRRVIPDTRECPGCKKLIEYDPDVWGNIAAGKGTLYACELCALKVEMGRMERIPT